MDVLVKVHIVFSTMLNLWVVFDITAFFPDLARLGLVLIG
jgi:hypothetical protein